MKKLILLTIFSMWGIWSYGQQKSPYIKLDSLIFSEMDDQCLYIRSYDDNGIKKGSISFNGHFYYFKIINNRVKGTYPYEIELDHNRHVISIYNRKTKLMTRVKVISKPFQLANTITN